MNTIPLNAYPAASGAAMTPGEFLAQGRRLNEMILFSTERLRELRASADAVGALRMKPDRVQSSPAGEAPYVRALGRIWALEEEIDRDLQLMIRLDRQIDGLIGTLLNGDYRMVLRYRYQNRKTWSQIADLMHIDPSTAKRWHAAALGLLTLPEDAVRLGGQGGGQGDGSPVHGLTA